MQRFFITVHEPDLAKVADAFPVGELIHIMPAASKHYVCGCGCSAFDYSVKLPPAYVFAVLAANRHAAKTTDGVLRVRVRPPKRGWESLNIPKISYV